MENTPDTSATNGSNARDTPGATWSVIRTVRRNQSHRFTPYQKTPACRTVRRGARFHPITGIAQSNSKISDIINKTWRVYRVSPFYKFSKTPSSLKAYGKSLSSYVKAQGQKSVAVDTEGETADSAQITLNRELRLTADDHEAIEIVLKQKTRKGAAATDKVVFIAHLICIKENSDKQATEDNFTRLPVMIAQGAAGITEHVLTWLQNKFDCAVHQMKFTPTMLSWMLTMFAGHTPGENKKPKQVHLTFKVPESIKGLSTVSLNIDGKRCQDLWNCIHRENSDDFSQAEVVSFVKSIESHFYHHFKIDLEGLLLQRIGTSVLYAGSEGKVKIFSKEYAFHVLKHLTDLSLESTLKPAVEDE